MIESTKHSPRRFTNRSYQLLIAATVVFFTLSLTSCRVLESEESGLKSLSLTSNSVASPGDTSVSYTSPSGYLYRKVNLDLGSSFQSINFCYGKTIMGIPGSAFCLSCVNLLASNAFRDIGSTQLTQAEEVALHPGSVDPPASRLPSTYHPVPTPLTDDEGFYTTDAPGAACAVGCTNTPIQSITSVAHAGMVVCGTAQATVDARIAHCQAQNPIWSTWTGSSSSSGGEATWSLVTVAANGGAPPYTEVWRDNRTGLLWSTLSNTSSNWCGATGNSDTTDPASYCGGNVASSCSEFLKPVDVAVASITSGFTGDNYVGGTYGNGKGGMGYMSTPHVLWHAPSVNELKEADLDGIRFVMPDMGAQGYLQTEWTATLKSSATDRALACTFASDTGKVQCSTDRNSGSLPIRCVGQ